MLWEFWNKRAKPGPLQMSASFQFSSHLISHFSEANKARDKRKRKRETETGKKQAWLLENVGQWGAPLWVQGWRWSLKDLPSAGWYHSQEWLYCHQEQALQGLSFFFSFLFLDLILWILIWVYVIFRNLWWVNFCSYCYWCFTSCWVFVFSGFFFCFGFNFVNFFFIWVHVIICFVNRSCDFWLIEVVIMWATY